MVRVSCSVGERVACSVFRWVSDGWGAFCWYGYDLEERSRSRKYNGTRNTLHQSFFFCVRFTFACPIFSQPRFQFGGGLDGENQADGAA